MDRLLTALVLASLTACTGRTLPLALDATTNPAGGDLAVGPPDGGTPEPPPCPPGTSGPRCEPTPPDPCTGITCEHDGHCVAFVTTFQCDCGAGYKGLRCETELDECAQTSCGDTFSCIDGIAAATCTCVDASCLCTEGALATLDLGKADTGPQRYIVDPKGSTMSGGYDLELVKQQGLHLEAEEHVDVVFATPASRVTYDVRVASNVDGRVGWLRVDATDANGVALGTADFEGTGVANVSASFGGALLSSIRISTMTGSVWIDRMTFALQKCR